MKSSGCGLARPLGQGDGNREVAVDRTTDGGLKHNEIGDCTLYMWEQLSLT